MTLTLAPRPLPSLDEQIVDLVARLRAAKLRAIAAVTGDEQYAAVIIPPPRGYRGGGQYHVAPIDGGLRVRWRPTDGKLVTVDVVDTAAHAAALILDHLAGLYP
jgi:hypothetical protein